MKLQEAGGPLPEPGTDPWIERLKVGGLGGEEPDFFPKQCVTLRGSYGKGKAS